MSEKPLAIKKWRLPITNKRYQNSQTSPLAFSFEAHIYPEIEKRLSHTHADARMLDGQALYLLDHFLSEKETQALSLFAKNASYSRTSYGSEEAIQEGEKPALSMNGKERWDFFFNPPDALKPLVHFFQTLAARLQIDVITLPWDLSDGFSTSPCTIANFVESVSERSMELGKHQDYHPEKELPFGIPNLYESGSFHPTAFKNGDIGRPYILSFMVYVTADNFDPSFQMGTRFWEKGKDEPIRVSCRQGRIVCFEGDIWHSLETSCIPEGIETWRVSYVYKLILNPQKVDQNVKESLFTYLKDSCHWLETKNRSQIMSS